MMNKTGNFFAGARPVRNEQGIALFMVLWIMALLSVMVAEFCYTARTEVNITRNFKEETEAYYIARAGVTTALNELLRLQSTPLRAPAEDDTEAAEGKIEWQLDAAMPPISFEQGVFEVSIRRENGKININRADAPLLKAMLAGFELTEEEVGIIVDSILDWRDADNLHRLNGAESDYYQDLDPPYKAKNQDFDSVEELQRVRGITQDIYNALKGDLTIYPKKKKDDKPPPEDEKIIQKSEADFNKVHLNAATDSMLKELPGMTPEGLAAIREFRAEKAFKRLDELIPLVGEEAYAKLFPYLTLSSEGTVFCIRSVGSVADGEIRRGIQVLVEVDLTMKSKYRIIEWMDDIPL